MAKKRKLIDLTGFPFIVEQHEDGKWYIVGVKVRKRDFLFTQGLDDETLQRITGTPGNDRIDGLQEIENFLEGQKEDEKLGDKIPDEFATDQDMNDAWQQALANAQATQAPSE